MPESMSIERRRLMSLYGAEFVLTPKRNERCFRKAKKISKRDPNSWSPLQFENPANIEIHKKTTALEIIKAFPDGLDYMITGVGTGGHITGCAAILKQHYPKKVFAVEPEASQLLVEVILPHLYRNWRWIYTCKPAHRFT
jgi:cysteine synthase A